MKSPRKIWVLSVVLLALGVVAAVFSDPSVDWQEVDDHIVVILNDLSADLTLVEYKSVGHIANDVPAWVRFHPMRLYYRATRPRKLRALADSDMSYTLQDASLSLECIVRYIDRRACCIVLRYPAELKATARTLKGTLSGTYGGLPVVLEQS